MSKMNILDLMRGDEIQDTWFEFEDGFELLLGPSTAEEQRRMLRPKAGQSEVSDVKRTKYWLGHVKDWRGLEDKDGNAVPFDAAMLRVLWDRRGDFNAWLSEHSQAIDSFRLRARAEAAGKPSGALAAVESND